MNSSASGAAPAPFSNRFAELHGPPSPDETARLARLLEEARAIKGVSLWQDARRRLRRNPAARASLAFLLLLGLVALFTPLLPLQSPIKQDLKRRQFLPPNVQPVTLGIAEHDRETDRLRGAIAEASGEALDALRQKLERHVESHPRNVSWNKPNFLSQAMIRGRIALFGDWCVPSICGTDHLGRDVLARICWGARISLIVGIVATCVSLVIGVSYGAIAGYFGGLVDMVMMRIVDILYSIPFLFVVIFALTFLSEPKIKGWLATFGIDQLVIFYILIGAIYWLTMSRVVRGQIISLKNEQFVEAARTIGAGPLLIVFRHLVPNTMGIVIVYLTLTIPAVMLFEAFLSFLGMGVTPPDVSWGILMNDGLQVITPIRIYWWLVVFPGLALTLTLFALNFLGDGLRDALDPRLKNR